jgi:aspartate aminotransferase
MAGGLAGGMVGGLAGAGSEIWSAPAAPVQHAAALAFAEPPPICQRIAASRALHATVTTAVARVCANAGLIVPLPQAGFYVYPDFEPWRDHLRARQVTTSAGLARLLLDRYGAATLPGSAFGDPPATLRLRLATALLYGHSEEQQEAALAASDPTALPPITTALTRLSEILTDLANPVPGAASPARRAEQARPMT